MALNAVLTLISGLSLICPDLIGSESPLRQSMYPRSALLTFSSLNGTLFSSSNAN